MLFGGVGCQEEPGRLLGPDESGPHACAELGWRSSGSLRSARGVVAAANRSSEVVIALDGEGNSEIYRVSAAAWMPGPIPASVRVAPQMVSLSGGRVLLADGVDAAGAPVASEFLPRDSAAWEAAGAMGSGPVGLLVSLDESALSVGGPAAGMARATVERFEPDAGWSPAGSLVTARADHFAVRLTDGRVLVGGGRDQSDNTLASVELFEPESAMFSPANPLLTARRSAAAVLLADDRVLVAGGFDDNGGELSSAEIYDPDSGIWRPAAALAHGRAGFRLTRTANGAVLAAGGTTASAEAVSESELFELREESWRPATAMTAPRIGDAEVVLKNRQILSVGGLENQQPAQATEVFCPPLRPSN